MDGMFWVNVIMRWLHVASAAVAVGATAVQRFALLPVLERAARRDLEEAVRAGLRKLVHSALGLLLLTGLYNYIVVAIPRLREVKEQAALGTVPAIAAERLQTYHPVMGLKILLALAVFALAGMLLGRVPAVQPKRRRLLTVTFVLGLVVIALGSYLRRLW